jgi:hypothetical protein
MECILDRVEISDSGIIGGRVVVSVYSLVVRGPAKVLSKPSCKKEGFFICLKIVKKVLTII